MQFIIYEMKQENRARNDAAPVLFGLKFANNIRYKCNLCKSSQASKARLQSSKQNLTQNGHSRSFKVTCFRVTGKAIKD